MANILEDNVFEDLNDYIIEKYKNNGDIKLIKEFISYLKYEKNNTEFIIDFNKVEEYCGFSTKGSAKRLLVNKFKRNIDYIIEENIEDKFNRTETIKLTINCFITFSLLTPKNDAKKINVILNELYNIRNEFINKIYVYNKNLLDTHYEIANKFIHQSGCYIGIINKLEEDGFVYYKLGSTNNLTNREIGHKREFNNSLYYRHFYQADKYIILENIMKKNKLFIEGRVDYEGHKEVFRIEKEKAEQTIAKLLKDSVTEYKQYLLTCDPNSLPYIQELTKQKEIDRDIRLAEELTKQKEIDKERDIELSRLLNKRMELQLEFEKEKLSIFKKRFSL